MILLAIAIVLYCLWCAFTMWLVFNPVHRMAKVRALITTFLGWFKRKPVTMDEHSVEMVLALLDEQVKEARLSHDITCSILASARKEQERLERKNDEAFQKFQELLRQQDTVSEILHALAKKRGIAIKTDSI